MPPRPRARSGVFLVRVWLEDESLLRARIAEAADLTDARETIALVGSADEVERRLRDWLGAFTERERVDNTLVTLAGSGDRDH